jgi:hypothetical protein
MIVRTTRSVRQLTGAGLIRQLTSSGPIAAKDIIPPHRMRLSTVLPSQLALFLGRLQRASRILSRQLDHRATSAHCRR